MKTKEFIKRVEALGWFVEKHLEETFVVDYRGNPLALISENERNAMDTNNDELIPDELFALVIEYARTPIEERKEQPLYGVFLKSDDSVLTRFYHNYMDLDGHSYESEIVALPTPNRQLAEAIALIECGGVYKVTE